MLCARAGLGAFWWGEGAARPASVGAVRALRARAELRVGCRLEVWRAGLGAASGAHAHKESWVWVSWGPCAGAGVGRKV